MERLTIQFKTIIIPLLLLFVLMMSGCALIGGGGDEEENSVQPAADQTTLPVGSSATLTCSQACSDRGFCGTDFNGAKLIILNSSAPATVRQDLTLPENTAVTIFEVRQPEAVLDSTQDHFFVDYYLVNAAELGQGWVSSWCIGP